MYKVRYNKLRGDFMRDFLAKISDFMYGRYGIDKLNIALAIFWFVMRFLNTIIIRNIWVHIFLYLIIILVIFRSLSRNKVQRTKENEAFLNFCFKIRPFTTKVKDLFFKFIDWFKLLSKKFKDRKTHRYLKCPYCKATIRVPLRRGNHTVNCPKCREYFKTNIKF